MDLDAVRTGFPVAVPMVATLGLEFVELSYDRAVLRMPDQKAYHNHVAGPHAGAMFTLAESASGALVLANFGDRLGEATPLAVEATIRYRRLAKGDVRAEATMSRSAGEILDELGRGLRPEFDVPVVLSTDDGTVTGEMTVRWTLRPNRAD